MAHLANVNITIEFTDEGRPQICKTQLLDKAIVIIENLAHDHIDYSMRCEFTNIKKI